MLHQFPFVTHGVHRDKGSKFINHQVAGLLEKVYVAFTRRVSDDRQRVVGSKKGAVIRKHAGYGAIAAEHAQASQKPFTARLNPYLNFHCPCGFATSRTGNRSGASGPNGPEDYRTPFEKLTSTHNLEGLLQPDLLAEHLRSIPRKTSHTKAGRKMQGQSSSVGECRGAK
jgi:hypothetical protein